MQEMPSIGIYRYVYKIQLSPSAAYVNILQTYGGVRRFVATFNLKSMHTRCKEGVLKDLPPAEATEDINTNTGDI